MKAYNLEQQFQTIVRTLLSTQPVEPRIIREHIKQYAESAGIPYSLAKQAVILKAKDVLIKRLENI